MKKSKKVVIPAILMTLCLGVSGCSMPKEVENYINELKGAVDEVSGNVMEAMEDAGDAVGEAVDDIAPDINEGFDEIESALNDITEDIANPKKADGEHVVIQTGLNDNYVFEFDSLGNPLKSYDLKEIMNSASNQDFTLSPYNYACCYDGVLYYKCYAKDATNSKYIYSIVAYEPSTKKYCQIYRCADDNKYLTNIDVFNGVLSFAVLGYDSSGCQIFCYEKTEGELEYNEVSPMYSEFYDKINDYNLSYIGDGLKSGSSCFDRIVYNKGILIGKKDGAYYYLFQDGGSKLIEATGTDNHFIDAYDYSGVIFHKYDDTFNFEGNFYYNRESGRMVELPETALDNMICYRDGWLYYYTEEESEYHVAQINVYREYPNTGEKELLLTKYTIPGVYGYNPGAEAFTLLDDEVLYTDLSGDTIKFFKAKIEDGKLTEAKDINCPVEKIDAFSYGTVEHISKSFYCPKCGIPLSQAYAEYLVINDESEGAAAINKELKDIAENTVSYYGEPVEVTDEECREHQEYEAYMFNETNDEYVRGAGVIDDRYFYVNMEGYWYGGGAHGMPFKDQYIFDHDTGKRLTLKDFYKGTEDEFKKLIATKTKENYEQYGSDNPYFAANADECYDSAYDSANLSGCVEFIEDGIIYSFMPYDMGPFSSGFIDIFVSYKDLLGRDTLAEN